MKTLHQRPYIKTDEMNEYPSQHYPKTPKKSPRLTRVSRATAIELISKACLAFYPSTSMVVLEKGLDVHESRVLTELLDTWCNSSDVIYFVK